MRSSKNPLVARGPRVHRGFAVVALAVFFAVVAVPASGSQVTARSTVDASPAQAWTNRIPYGSYPPSGSYPLFPTSSPAVGDVTGDGQLDVVMGGMDGRLRVYSASSGALEATTILDGPIQSSPVLVDLYGRGRPQVLISTASTAPGHSSTVRVLLYSGSTATQLFRQTSTHPLASPIANHMQPFLATPTYGDIDGDGSPEIVAVNLDQHLYAWHLDGRQVFPPKFLYDTLFSSPVVVDWNHDGKGEIVFGADSGNYPPFPDAKGVLWSIDGHGNPSPGYPIKISDQVIWAAPTVTDLNGDGNWDVVFGTGMNYGGDGGSRVFAYDLAHRTPLPGFPAATAGRTYSNPAVVDLNGTGAKEVLIGTGRGWLYAFDAQGHRLWRQCTTRFSACTENGDASGVTFLQVNPAVADIDADGRLEVVVSTEKDLKVYDAATGTPENFTPTPTARNGPVTVAGAYVNAATPSIAQVDGHAMIFLDGLEQVGSPFRPKVGDNGFLQAWQTDQPLGAAPWPTDKGSFNRRGIVGSAADTVPLLRSFVAATRRDFLDRDATGAELAQLSSAIADGVQSRSSYLRALVNSDAWLAALLTNFYAQTLGRPPDQSGLAYWETMLRSGRFTVAQVAARFYASPEYFAGIGGGTTRSWVTNLYAALLHRTPDAAGLAYWSSLAAKRGRVAVAAAFYQSDESSRTRVRGLYASLLGRAPDASGLAYWAGVIPERGDLSLALLLASSSEYASRAVSRFPGI